MRRQVGFPCNLSIWPEHSWKSGTVHEAVGLWPQRNKTLSRKHHAARLLTAWTATWAQAGTTDSNCSSLGPSRWAKFWLFSEWITNKDVLHNTWNRTQCYVPALIVGRGGEEWVLVSEWLSPSPVHLKLPQYCSSAIPPIQNKKLKV